MTVYYDTGVVLKLYTLEKESAAVREFVMRRKSPLHLNTLHFSECVSALRLKCFRGECEEVQVSRAIADIEDDSANGVIRRTAIDWDTVWSACRELSNTHAASTGCRTLDALHVACARSLALREFITTDRRQAELAERAGLRVVDPVLAE